MTAATATATTATPDVAKAYLSVNNIEVIYDHVILVLKGVSLHVPEGRIVALLGANGAGKTTTLKAISNLLRAERGDVTKGTIEFEGKRMDKLTPNQLVRMGVCQVMEGRHCFQHLTVEENLLTGAFTRKDSRKGNRRIAREGLPLLSAAQAKTREPGGVHVGARRLFCVSKRVATSAEPWPSAFNHSRWHHTTHFEVEHDRIFRCT